MIKSNKRELAAVGGIWLFLFVFSLTAWFLLKVNANRIINHIEYVETGRFGRAEVLYEEGKKFARSLYERSGKLNKTSGKKVAIPSNDREVAQALALYHRAEQLDPRPRHDPQRALHYDFQGGIYDIIDNRAMQHVLHAEAFLSRGDVANALHYVSLASELDTTSPETLLVKGYAEVAAGDTSAALSSLSKLYATGRVSSRARMLRAEILFGAGDHSEALKELREALAADAVNSDIYKRLATYQLHAGLKEEALETFRNGVPKGGNTDGNYMHLYGTLLTDHDKIDEAIDALETAAELEAHSGAIQWDLARAYNKAGKSGLAGRAMQLAIKLDPSLADQLF